MGFSSIVQPQTIRPLPAAVFTSSWLRTPDIPLTCFQCNGLVHCAILIVRYRPAADNQKFRHYLRGKSCFNCVPIASAATKIFRPNPPKLSSAPSSVHSAQRVPFLFLMVLVQTAAVNCLLDLGGHWRNLLTVQLLRSAFTNQLVAKRRSEVRLQITFNRPIFVRYFLKELVRELTTQCPSKVQRNLNARIGASC